MNLLQTWLDSSTPAERQALAALSDTTTHMLKDAAKGVPVPAELAARISFASYTLARDGLPLIPFAAISETRKRCPCRC